MPIELGSAPDNRSRAIVEKDSRLTVCLDLGDDARFPVGRSLDEERRALGRNREFRPRNTICAVKRKIDAPIRIESEPGTRLPVRASQDKPFGLHETIDDRVIREYFHTHLR
jgi:hypothetical protein